MKGRSLALLHLKTYVREPKHGICILDFSYAIKHTKSQMVDHFLLLSICFSKNLVRYYRYSVDLNVL